MDLNEHISKNSDNKTKKSSKNTKIKIPKQFIKNKRKRTVKQITKNKKNINSMKLIYQIKNDVKNKFKKLKKSDKNYNNKLINLLNQNNLNNDVVFEYLNNIDIKLVNINDLQFFKFILSPQQQTKLIKKNIFKEIFDSKQELINMLQNLNKKNDNEIIQYFEDVKKKINLKNINTPFIYILNYDQENMFAFCFFIIFELLNNINNNRINYIKQIIKKFFSEYINNLTSKNINKNDLLYIYFTFFNFEYTNDLTKINEKFKKKDFDELKHKFKKIKFNEIGKKIILSKFETIVDKCGYNNETFKEIYKYEIFPLKRVQENNFFFFNKKMKNYYLMHLKNLLFSNIMKNIFNEFKDDFINTNTEEKKYEYLFTKESSFIELKKHLYFFPFKIEESIRKISGITIKNTMDIIIFIYPKNIINLSLLLDKYGNKIFLINHVLNSGYFIITMIHETSGHYLFTYYYYLQEPNIIITTSTPKDSKINKFLTNKLGDKVEKYDRGSQIECLLFGDIISRLTFWGAIFILTVDFSKFNNFNELEIEFKKYNKSKIEKKLLDNLDLKGSNLLKEIFNKYGYDMKDLKAKNFLDEILEKYSTLSTRPANNDIFSINFDNNNDTNINLY